MISPQLSTAERRRWERSLHFAKRALDNGEPSQAAAQLELAQSLAPTHAETNYLLGQAREQLEQWDQARDAYYAACDNDASPQRRLSAINEAIRTVARESDALLVDVYQVFAAESRHGVVGFDLVEDYVHPSLEGHRRIAWQLWQAIEQVGWLGSSVEPNHDVFEKIAVKRATNATAPTARWFCNQAVVLVNQERLGEAVAKLQEAANLFPADANVHWRLASLLASQNEFQGAAHHYEVALEADPAAAGGWMNLGVVYERLGDFETAEAHLKRAIRMDPENAVAHYNLGVVLEKSGQLDDARGQFAAAIKLQPSFHEAHARLSNLLKPK